MGAVRFSGSFLVIHPQLRTADRRKRGVFASIGSDGADRQLAMPDADRERAEYLDADATREQIMRAHLLDFLDLRLTFRFPDGEVLSSGEGDNDGE